VGAIGAGNLAFPLLLVGGLFLLSRRGGGAGGPGGIGGNNPLQFGKSKAKFQMEPNTGVTFDDVAGVQEAKEDFMEVRGSRISTRMQHFGHLKPVASQVVLAAMRASCQVLAMSS